MNSDVGGRESGNHTGTTAVLVTGATGFVGTSLVEMMASDGRWTVVAATRSESAVIPDDVDSVPVGDLSANTNWQFAVSGADVVVHCAARVHVMDDKANDPLAEFRRVMVVSIPILDLDHFGCFVYSAHSLLAGVLLCVMYPPRKQSSGWLL